MNVKIAVSNVVIVAKNFNPTIVDKHWLIVNGIMDEHEFEEGCFFTPVVSHIISETFSLLILPERLQFSIKKELDDEQSLIVYKLGKIVKTLPHSPYSAAGLNFTLHLDVDSNFPEFNRKFFFINDSQLYHNFDDENARFGAYLSKDFFCSRLRLDVKPVTLSDTITKKEMLQFSFNFHSDIAIMDDKIKGILDLLDLWSEAKKYSIGIANEAKR